MQIAFDCLALIRGVNVSEVVKSVVELVGDGDQQCSTTLSSKHGRKKYFPARTRQPNSVSSLDSCITRGCRSGGSIVDVCHVAVHDWYHRLEHLFEPDRDRRGGRGRRDQTGD